MLFRLSNWIYVFIFVNGIKVVGSVRF